MTAPNWKWQDSANGRGESVDVFFPAPLERTAEKDRREDKAKAICSQCPARAACLDFAIRTGQVGFWGGLNDDQRKSERRRRMRRAASAGISAA
jgi:WhiB family transcriptional regulator, redox-sensing transcriptional regulator